MDKICDGCEALKEPKHQIIQTDYWAVGLSNNQAYFGRAFVTLKEHKASLSALNDEEWQDFEQLVRKLEKAYKEVYGAEPLNWGCYMNNAFRTQPYNPHVHWHIYPRYKKPPELNGEVFDDPLFGEFYDNDAERIVSDEVVEQIASKLSQYLSTH